ncbi:immunity 22 family protein [Chitinivorax sp. B]|uniref:immunity 22 family protein n=1 Tax=Chitinivorax sp. B TaxID=2502235 RepID=UPI0010F8207C|nr:immunity 22 family protein [Chitinivorax sp. B]
MFEKDGVVSAWIGNFSNEDELFSHVQKIYDQDGNSSSDFLSDFKLGWYDEDFSEANFIDLQDLRNSLAAHSYSDSFLSSLMSDLAGKDSFNSIYLIYDIDASALSSVAGRMKFLGVYGYTK